LQKMVGKEIDLRSHHQHISSIALHLGVTQVLRRQFNIARNMALYSFFLLTGL
jgi:hypothetical protein